jgi:HEXXH motif-containing protein
MSVRVHRISRRLFDSLAAGGGGAEAIHALAAAQYSKHVILLRGVLSAAEAAGAQQAGLARQGYELLAAAQQSDRAAADAVIRYPSVGAWALQAARALTSGQADADHNAAGPAAQPGGLCWVGVAAAIRAGLVTDAEVPVIGGSVVLPSLGVASVDAEGAVVRSAGGHSEIVWADGKLELSPDAAGWSGLRQISAGSLQLIIDDVDPFRMPAAPFQSPRLSSAEVRAWDEVFQHAWELLEQSHPQVACELAAATSVIVPLAAPSTGRLSSSSPETFGAIALSEPSDPCTLAVTLAHELQHLKLSALLDIVPLTQPDDGRLFYAPWRSDPRPLGGLLQGAYAFLGVSDFWRRQRHLERGDAAVRANAEFARWRAAAAQVVTTLMSSGLLTPAGVDFVRGMAQELGAWENDEIPEEARTLARREAEEHLTAWQDAHGLIETDDAAAF